ncbi:T9SS type A sorting domain-containing protein [Flavobacterium sp. SM2513]|uniref:T9SS type A sorting domain-containing protein n=1 Tax=Flavobacterium sp. SM2513 TaxID=3424766 RepID=UPI003D7F2408
MKKLLLLTILFSSIIPKCFSQTCTLGTQSDETGIGENIGTGGIYEYAGAVDFDVPFGVSFTTTAVTFNILKGSANLNYVNVAFLMEEEGLPATIIVSHSNLIPTTQTLVSTSSDEGGLDVYSITVNLPEAATFAAGKYFLTLAAAPGDSSGAWWEITSETQTYGAFDFIKFGTEAWAGAGYYNKVFNLLGTCTDTGEILPDLGFTCDQQSLSTLHNNGVSFFGGTGMVLSLADDFTVEENTTFHLKRFTLETLLTGGAMHNATIKIRTATINGPGEVLHTFLNKGPDYEEFQGYWVITGSPFDLVSVKTSFVFNDAIALEGGRYYIEVIPTPNSSDLMLWEATAGSGIGEFSYSSSDGGNSWFQNAGVNQNFAVEGFCEASLGVLNPESGQQFTYFPNPVVANLTISSPSQISTMALYTVTGQEIGNYSTTTTTIDMNDLASGLYLLKVQFENGVQETFKILKK